MRISVSPVFSPKLFSRVGAGGAADIAVRAHRHPQRLGVERGDRLALEPEHQRHAADDIVPVAVLVDEAVALGAALKLGQVADRRRVIVDEAQRVGARRAGEGKPGMRDERAVARRVAKGEAEHDRGLGDRLGEALVGVGHRGQQLFGVGLARPAARQHRHQHLGRGAVGLAEKDVEGDDRRPRRIELVDEFGDDAARPRPLPDRLEAFVVDRDDAHRQVLCRPRDGALEAVEGEQREPVEKVGDDEPGERGQQQQRQRQPIDDAALEE